MLDYESLFDGDLSELTVFSFDFCVCFLSAKKQDFQAFQDDSFVLTGTLNLTASDTVYPPGTKKKKKHQIPNGCQCFWTSSLGFFFSSQLSNLNPVGPAMPPFHHQDAHLLIGKEVNVLQPLKVRIHFKVQYNIEVTMKPQKITNKSTFLKRKQKYLISHSKIDTHSAKLFVLMEVGDVHET